MNKPLILVVEDDILRCWKASRLEKREKRPKDRITDLRW